MLGSRLWLLAVVVPVLAVAGAASAGPYWGARYSDGRGVVCRDIGTTNTEYYAMFTVPTPAGGLTTSQRAAVIASRLNSLYDPARPYRTTQICNGVQNGQHIIYIANRNGNNWLVTTIDTAWARKAGTTPLGAARYWRDRMRYLATNWVIGPSGNWEAVLTASGEGHKPTPDQKLLANPKVCDKMPKGYENRSSKDPVLKGTVKPLPTTVPEGEQIRDL